VVLKAPKIKDRQPKDYLELEEQLLATTQAMKEAMALR
jgi:hypothetical protein